MTGFSLRALVTETADAHPEVVDPGELADLVDAKIDDRDCRAALRETLRDYVRRTVAPAAPSVTTRPGASWRQGERRGAFAWAAGNVFVRDGYKPIRDLTREDCAWLAADRDKRANEMHVAARGWRATAALIVEHDVERLGDLPADVLARVRVES